MLSRKNSVFVVMLVGVLAWLLPALANATTYSQWWSGDMQPTPSGGGKGGTSDIVPAIWPSDSSYTGTPGTDVWNLVQFAAGTSVNPVFSLVNNTGAASPVTFTCGDSVTGNIGAYSYSTSGNEPIGNDYFYSTGSVTNFTFSNLTPGGTYELTLFGGHYNNITRAYDARVDTNGNGLLTDETPITAINGTDGSGPATLVGGLIMITPPTNLTGYATFYNITAGPAGTIIGALTPSSAGLGAEADWGGFQLRQVQVPEPSTLVLVAAGLAGLLCYAWRKRR